MKKADLSINTIVIAVIAVLVLVVLVLIFTGKLHWFQQTTSNCEDNLKGECLLPTACDAVTGSNLGVQDCKGNEICCTTTAS